MIGPGVRTALVGTGLVLVYTALISSADGITKLIAGGYSAPQLYCLSGLIVMALSVAVDRHPGRRHGLATRCPRAMAVRSAATVVAAVSFFYAFRYLPFAQVFIFIGLMPILAGLMSGPILGEHVRPAAWFALIAGFAGVTFLFPAGAGSISAGHVFALVAAVSGTLSMVMARFIGRRDTNTLSQVFYPNLAIFLSMGLVLPLVWKPMPLTDVAWVVAYAGLLFLARWLLVLALRLLAAYAVTPLMNLQFVWMVAIGAVFFGEYPSGGTYAGVIFVIASGIFLVWEQFSSRNRAAVGFEVTPVLGETIKSRA